MAFSVKQGVLTASATASAQAVSGLGFQPKALIFFAVPLTATGSGAHASEMVGFATSATQMTALAGWSSDASGPTATSRTQTATKCIQILSGQSTVGRTATLTSMDSDGFTITWGETGTQFIVYWLALGGTDLTNAKAGTFATITGTGSQSVTGVGFQPDLVLALGSGQTTFTTATEHVWRMSAFTASAAKALAAYDQNSVGTTYEESLQKTDALAATDGAGNASAEASLTSMDSDGFTMNWASANGAAVNYGYLALKGGQYFVGVDTQKTSTGTQAKTGVGFTPKGLFFFSRGLAAGTTVDTTVRKLSVGATDGTNQGAIWNQSTDNVATSVAKQVANSTNALVFESNPTPTLNAAATISSLDADGYTLNWGTADATAREFAVVAFGNAAATSMHTGPFVAKTEMDAEIVSETPVFVPFGANDDAAMIVAVIL